MLGVAPAASAPGLLDILERSLHAGKSEWLFFRDYALERGGATAARSDWTHSL